MRLIRAAAFSLALLFAPTMAFAAAAGPVVTVQTAPASGLTSPATTPGSTVTTVTTAPAAVVIPWGDWIDAAINQIVIPVLSVVVLSLLTWAAARLSPLLPSWLRGVVNAKNTAALEQLLVPSLATGLKAAGTAVDGKTLDIGVNSAATASALQFALAHGSDALIKWAGGPEAIRDKIKARFAMLDTGLTAQTMTTVASTSTISMTTPAATTPLHP